MSGLERIPDSDQAPRHVRKVPILLQKSFWGDELKIFRSADASCASRREGPHHFIQKRPPVFVSAAKGIAAGAASKNRLSRDFRGRSIFDFCNNICHKQTSLMLYSITSSAMPSVGGIVTPSAFAVLRKLAREFVVRERRRSDRKQCRTNPDRPQHKDGYRALPTGTACNPKQYWKKT
jgi:hypothetical protein